MYPIKFRPILKSTIWGGERIKEFKELETTQIEVGESWELSNVPGSESIVANGVEAGKTISELLKKYKDALVGQENYKLYGDNFPLLIKFIDAREDLSIQVHPNDELAKKRHNSFGKTEMWYVIDNNGGEAKLRSGLKEKMTPEEYAVRVKENTICDALAEYRVNPGDVFFLPAGRIHSIGAGCLIAEIQQTSNITYRIYDFNRKDKNGNSRELHTEFSKDAIDYAVKEEYRTLYKPAKDYPVDLVQCPYFNTALYDLTETQHINYEGLDSFVIYVCVAGAATVVDSHGNEERMKAGETVLIPATLTDITIVPDNQVKFLETYV
ncbi:MAG: type I phosphomannose isomerase catalytic subunit [Bacteroidales bacterium]